VEFLRQGPTISATVRTELPVIAPVAEKYGDFRLGEFCRRGEARYYRAGLDPTNHWFGLSFTFTY